MNKVGIKESKEFIDALKLVAKTGKKINADGKVDLKDLPHVIELATNSSVLASGVEGAGQIPEEIKDLTTEEFAELGQYLVNAIIEVRNS